MEKSMANKDKNKSGGHEVPTLPPTGQCESLRSLVFAILLHRETFPISSQPSGLVAGSYAGNCHEPHCLLFEYYLSSSSIGGTRIVSSFTECSFCYALYVLYAGCSVPTSNRSSFCWWARGTLLIVSARSYPIFHLPVSHLLHLRFQIRTQIEHIQAPSPPSTENTSILMLPCTRSCNSLLRLCGVQVGAHIFHPFSRFPPFVTMALINAVFSSQHTAAVASAIWT